MTYTYPITITEIPHMGTPRTWTLWNAEHLDRCICTIRWLGRYDEFQSNQGRLEYVEMEDGETETIDHGAYTLDAYLDWLRHDLSQLIVREGEEDAE